MFLIALAVFVVTSALTGAALLCARAMMLSALVMAIVDLTRQRQHRVGQSSTDAVIRPYS
jgi:hypothetical protein